MDFKEQLSLFLKKRINSKFLKISDHTSEILQNLGLADYPILIKTSSLKKDLFAGGSTGDNYHDLGVDAVVKLPELLESPVLVMNSLSHPNDSIVVVTEMLDKKSRPIILAIEPSQTVNYNFVETDVNLLLSTYGRERFAEFLMDNIAASTLLYVDKEKSQRLHNSGLQLPITLGFNGIIRQWDEDVKSLEHRIFEMKSHKFKNDGVYDKMYAEGLRLLGITNDELSRALPRELKENTKKNQEEKMDIPTTESIEQARERARLLVQETGEPFVTIERSENSELSVGDVLSLSEADKKLAALDRTHYGGNYDRVKLSIDYVKNGKADSYEDCIFDIGDEQQGLVSHIKDYWQFYLENKNWRKRLESQHSSDYVNAMYEEYDRMANDVAPFFQRHVELSDMIIKAETANLKVEEVDDVKAFVRQSRFETNGTVIAQTASDEVHEKSVISQLSDIPDSESAPVQREPANYRDKVNKVRDEMAQTLLDYIEKNPQNWQAGWNNLTAPINGKTNNSYKGFNALYLSLISSMRGYKDPRWVTFNQAKELGVSINKGEKSSPVVFFEFYDRLTKKAYDARTTKDMTEEERSEYEKENVYAVLKYSSVFNAAQCSNFPERDLDAFKMSEEERVNQNELIETIIANSSAPVRYDGGNSAYYSPATDSIHLPAIEAFNSMQDYYATALHEIAHSTGHSSRLNRDMAGGFGSSSYAVEELRAELACVFLQIEQGIQLEGKHIENHAAYLSSWLSAVKEDKSVFFKATADAQKIASYVEQHYLQAAQIDEFEIEQASEAQSEAQGEHKESSALDENIKQWYTATFPTDELGSEIKGSASFKDLNGAIENGADVYDLLGVSDSVVRERTFQRLAEIQGKSYEDVYLRDMYEIEEHTEKNEKRNDEMSVQIVSTKRNDVASETAESKAQSRWMRVNLPDGTVGKQYGTNTLIKMPEGEYSHYSFFLPSKLIRTTNDKKQMLVSADFIYRLNNDGRRVELTGQELRDSFAGMQIGKEYKRVAPSRAALKVFADLEKNVPDELKALPNWCVYRTWRKDESKKGKVIKSAVTGNGLLKDSAGNYNLNEFTDFSTALKYAQEKGFAGLSFLLDRKHGITCVDLDKCIINAQTGEMKERATKLVDMLNGTYMERSTSGNGIHIFVKEDVLKNGIYRSSADTKASDLKGDLEVFDNMRIISMTGDMISATNELKRAGSAATVYLRKELGEKPKPQAKPSTTLQNASNGAKQSDDEIIHRIRASKSGADFSALYDSNIGLTGDKSKDDYRLANMLLYFSEGDMEQTFRIMRSAQTYRPEKSDSYYRHTIEKADSHLNGNYAKRPNPFAVNGATNGTGYGKNGNGR